MQTTQNRLLHETDVARILLVSESWLQKARVHRKGPPFVKIGRSVRYRKSDIDAYIGSNITQPSEVM